MSPIVSQEEEQNSHGIDFRVHALSFDYIPDILVFLNFILYEQMRQCTFKFLMMTSCRWKSKGWLPLPPLPTFQRKIRQGHNLRKIGLAK